MFNFNKNSGWSFELELECFIIYKLLEVENFPRGKHSELCEQLAKSTIVSFDSIKAKVGNFKSELGVNNPSHSSEATVFIASTFGKMTLNEAKALLTGYQLGQKF
jgi:hypothetical protein